MKVNQVPQDDENMLNGKTREIQYAVDKDGKYVKIKSVGWKPKNIVMKQVWEDTNKEIEEARRKVKDGRASPIYYYMKKNMMTPKLLSEYTGIFILCVKRHLKPKPFNKLKNKTLIKYMEAFNLNSVKDINNIEE